MDAATWTLIAILGTAVVGSYGGFFYLGTKIDNRVGEVNRRIDAQGAELARRIEALDAKVDAQGARLDSRLDTQEVRIDRLSDQVAHLVVAVGNLTESVEAHLARHAG